MDWDAVVAQFEQPKGPDGLFSLFAEGGQFCDPVTPWTTDLRKVADDTAQIFPDWHATVDRLRVGDGWAVLEWTGEGTYRLEAQPVGVTVHGASVVEVDRDGKITRWRDYLDTNEPLGQIKAATS